MNQTQSFMDQSTFVERYAWFGAMENLQGVNPVGPHYLRFWFNRELTIPVGRLMP
jgi:hypothetical protein